MFLEAHPNSPSIGCYFYKKCKKQCRFLMDGTDIDKKNEIWLCYECFKDEVYHRDD